VPRGGELSRPHRKSKAASDEQADRILNMLRGIRGKQDQHDQKFDEVITRLSSLERDFAEMKLDFAGVHARLDNIGRRLDRVERRLERVDEPAS
jgi:archaellum component FlaC